MTKRADDIHRKFNKRITRLTRDIVKEMLDGVDDLYDRKGKEKPHVTLLKNRVERLMVHEFDYSLVLGFLIQATEKWENINHGTVPV
jgi:hypothetical protein